jgi:hypothetical protein
VETHENQFRDSSSKETAPAAKEEKKDRKEIRTPTYCSYLVLVKGIKILYCCSLALAFISKSR